MSDELELDLDVARAQRAAQREGQKRDMPLRVGGQVIAVLPVELPVDVLAPLRNLDGDLTLLLREAVLAAKNADGKVVNQDITELVIDLLANNPRLPLNFLDTIKEVAANLLAEEGLSALVASRPSAQDIAFLVKGVFRFYGVTLGEALPSSASSTDASGGTSSGTSSTTSDSTPATSGPTPEIATSSASAGS
jgi:hypothetical protein